MPGVVEEGSSVTKVVGTLLVCAVWLAGGVAGGGCPALGRLQGVPCLELRGQGGMCLLYNGEPRNGAWRACTGGRHKGWWWSWSELHGGIGVRGQG